MFTTSTQRRYWMYESPDDLDQLRKNANAHFVRHARVDSDLALTPKEELYLVRAYLVVLRDFCRKFQPTMWRSVTATAFVYLKRFFLEQSCMEYHPRDIGVTCAYLACKIDDFFVPIDEFIKNVNGDCQKAQNTVLSNEMLVMKKLKFHLTVHLPFRPKSGFLLDLRARFPPAKEKINLMEPEIDDFLEKAMYTDACFLYTPSQIALAAISYGAEKCGLDLSNYLSDIIFDNNEEALKYFQVASRDIKDLIETDLQNSPGKDTIKKIEKKLSDFMKFRDQ